MVAAAFLLLYLVLGRSFYYRVLIVTQMGWQGLTALRGLKAEGRICVSRDAPAAPGLPIIASRALTSLTVEPRAQVAHDGHRAMTFCF